MQRTFPGDHLGNVKIFTVVDHIARNILYVDAATETLKRKNRHILVICDLHLIEESTAVAGDQRAGTGKNNRRGRKDLTVYFPFCKLHVFENHFVVGVIHKVHEMDGTAGVFHFAVFDPDGTAAALVIGFKGTERKGRGGRFAVNVTVPDGNVHRQH